VRSARFAQSGGGMHQILDIDARAGADFGRRLVYPTFGIA
jgi:hypothetical protein